jgi:hypothetical protein
MATFLRIRRVDMDGFCGRDNHPTRADEGLIVVVVRTESVEISDDDDMITVHTVRTADGRTLDLIDHEVEPAPTPAWATVRIEASDLHCGECRGRLVKVFQYGDRHVHTLHCTRCDGAVR